MHLQPVVQARRYGQALTPAALLALLMVSVALLWPRPAQAGGWAVVTMERWPAHFVVGQETSIGLTVRQHGIHPVTLPEGVTILLHSPSGGDVLTVQAAPGTEPGQYLATLVFPESGEWQVEVQPSWFPPTVVTVQVMEMAAQTGAASVPVSALPAVRWLLILPVALIAGAAARWARRDLAWQLGAVLVVGGLAAAGLWWSSSATQAASATFQADSSVVDYGRMLFAAKGCTSCHRHDEVAASFSTEVGPNLTHYVGDPVWLEIWLKDPAALRPGTQMPNLGLSAEEIEALSAFLLAEEQAR